MNKEKEIEELNNRIKDLEVMNNDFFEGFVERGKIVLWLRLFSILEFLIIIFLGMVIVL